MNFSVIAVSTVPDAPTTRRLFKLDDLDDKAVSKVLFHRRKQQTGSSEELRWDQRAIASLTLIHHSVDGVRIDSLGLQSHSEEEMLHVFYKTALKHGRLVSWSAGQHELPLLYFRSMMHAVSYPAYWAAKKEGTATHLDICSWLAPGLDDRPTLDKTARKLGYPGMLDLCEDDVVEAWLGKNHDKVQAYSDIQALNAYLVALRLLVTTGEISRHDSARIGNMLRSGLQQRKQPHFGEFLSMWDGA